MDINKIINEEIDNVFEYERRRERRERDPNRQPRVGKEFKSGGKTFAKSRESGDETYKMRSMITPYIYEARDLVRKHFGVTPPKVTYRVVDWTPENVIYKDALGCAVGFGSRVILIPALTFDKYGHPQYLKHIIFHELLHAIYCVYHDESSKLMASHLPKKPLTSQEIDNWYVKHVEESGKSHLSDEGSERRKRY